MRKYKLIGYNSGGYKASRTILFDGEITLCYRSDSDNSDKQRKFFYFRVVHADGSVTEEENDFLQSLLDEQSYIERFLTVELEEIPLDKEDIAELNQERKEKFIARFYQTRYFLFLPLLYLLGEWLEGPSTREILLSKTFFITAFLLLTYVVIYFRKLNPSHYPLVSWLFHGLFSGAYFYMVLFYQEEIDTNFEVIKVLLLSMFGIHLSFWFGSLFDRKESS